MEPNLYNDLDRSVRLLQDALANDMSFTLSPHEIAELQLNKNFAYNETLANLIDGNDTITGGVIHRLGKLWSSVLDSLYMEFFEILQGHSGSQDVLEILADLARCCSDALNVIRGLKSKVHVSTEEERWLEKERDTWRLLFILYQDRLMSQNMMEEDEIIQYIGRSEKYCAENLFKRESLIREAQLVIDWLEAQACEKDDQVLHFSDTTVGWENTLHQLQSAETIAFGSSRQIVDKLDPDAPHYQNKPLHDLDMDDEKRLSQKIFHEIRCGKLDKAQKLARECGYSWKAAIFEGWRLFHDANIKENLIDDDRNSEVDDGYEEMGSNELKEIEGNSSRDIWKLMALNYCKQEWLNPYDKASIGSFCGCLNALLPVSPTWEDSLWAYMKCMVDIRVESEIRDCCTKDNGYTPLPEDYWLQRMSLNEVFSSLESSKNRTIREQAKEPEHVIQKHLILDEIPALLGDLKEWSESTNVSTHFLRFAAHLMLFLDQIGQVHKRDSIDKVIQAYIHRLMQMNKTQLIAFYVSKLSPSIQPYLYAQYLENIIYQHERKQALEYAEACGLDVLTITKQVVENIRNRPDDVEEAGNLQQKLSDNDKFKISAIDWLIFYESQRTEALAQTNRIIFKFLLLGKFDAAQLAFNKIPNDALSEITAQVEEGNVEVNKVIKEHLSYKAYLEAYEAFNEWFKQAKNKPSAPEEPSETAQFPEKVAYEHRVSQFKAELERWKLTTTHIAKTARTLLYNVLLFPEGWLVGAVDAEHLRKKVLPEVSFLLCSILTETEMYDDCVQIADIIASETHCLYKEFTKDQLRELLIKIGEASMALTKASEDPWGNEQTV